MFVKFDRIRINMGRVEDYRAEDSTQIVFRFDSKMQKTVSFTSLEERDRQLQLLDRLLVDDLD